MADERISKVNILTNILTFDIFGTVLDLLGSLVPPTGEFLAQHGASISGAPFWVDWRNRQRIELHHVDFNYGDVTPFMRVYQNLQLYPDAVAGLKRLAPHYSLVALPNGEQRILEHLVADNIRVPFDEIDEIISVDPVGMFEAPSDNLPPGCPESGKGTGRNDEGGGLPL